MVHIFMLEDDRDRIARFECVVSTLPGGNVTLTVHRSAHAFLDAYANLEQPPSLIALDHDLFSDGPDDPDPGDGRDVARYLAQIPPTSPVLIHSTNADAADSMLFCLQEAGWLADRIAPLGKDWIEAYWCPTAVAILQRTGLLT